MNFMLRQTFVNRALSELYSFCDYLKSQTPPHRNFSAFIELVREHLLAGLDRSYYAALPRADP